MGANKVILLGRLGKDPEMRHTSSGLEVCTLSVATGDRRKGADGAWRQETEWHRVIAFGVLAKNCHAYLKKGRQVYLEGTLRYDEWTDKNNLKHYRTEILAQIVEFLGSTRPASENGDGADNNSADNETVNSADFEDTVELIPDAKLFEGLKSADELAG